MSQSSTVSPSNRQGAAAGSTVIISPAVPLLSRPFTCRTVSRRSTVCRRTSVRHPSPPAVTASPEQSPGAWAVLRSSKSASSIYAQLCSRSAAGAPRPSITGFSPSP